MDSIITYRFLKLILAERLVVQNNKTQDPKGTSKYKQNAHAYKRVNHAR